MANIDAELPESAAESVANPPEQNLVDPTGEEASNAADNKNPVARTISTSAAKPPVLNLKPSIISEGFEFIGEIRSGGHLTIDGVVRGTLALQSIQIGTNGSVDATVSCDSVHVKGNFSGSLDCRDLTIGSRAVVNGNVSFHSITIQRGGVVKGELKKKN